MSCFAGYFYDSKSQCKRNDTYFALQQTGTLSATTVTAYVTVTQTSTSVSLTTSVYQTVSFSQTITAVPQQITVTSTVTTPSMVTVTNTIVSQQIQPQPAQTVSVTVTPQTGTIFVTATIAGSSGPSSAAQVGQANEVTIDFIGTLPISSLALAGVCLGIGALFAFLIALLCCRAKRSSKTEDFDHFGMTSTTQTNTAGQPTFTTRSSRG